MKDDHEYGRRSERATVHARTTLEHGLPNESEDGRREGRGDSRDRARGTIGATAASGAFDEPLDMARVNQIAALFIQM